MMFYHEGGGSVIKARLKFWPWTPRSSGIFNCECEVSLDLALFLGCQSLFGKSLLRPTGGTRLR